VPSGLRSSPSAVTVAVGVCRPVLSLARQFWDGFHVLGNPRPAPGPLEIYVATPIGERVARVNVVAGKSVEAALEVP
jgi:hypothetical protein